MAERTIWGVTSFDLGGNAGFVVHALFTSKEQADVYASVDEGYDVEEFSLYDEAPAPYTLWVRIAHVYPDGEVQEFARTETCQPPGMFSPVDDRDLFDGHIQGHCGFHIYVSGTDEGLVEEAFKKLIVRGVARADGTCSCGRTEGPYKRDFWDGLPTRPGEEQWGIHV